MTEAVNLAVNQAITDETMNELTNELIDGIAIVGMAGRFPGSANVDEFWQNLRNGVESIRFFSDEELDAVNADPTLRGDPNHVPAFGALDDIELFDAPFFGFTPREAEITDPQHRLFLECAWHALEHAGYDSEQYDGAIGVYAGVGVSSYAINNLFTNRDLVGLAGMIQTSINNRTDHLTTQTAYKLNLKGPGVTVQTACSTSLVAVHLACQSLFNRECDMALAGGVSVAVPQRVGYAYQEGGILSPDGHCRAFDAAAEGTVPGSGVGIVVLKRLEDALADGDTIHAVIRGSAINNDGSLKVGYTAPSVDGQAQAIAEALAVAGVDPHTIGYVETHGTGTALGDPIEVEALTRAFQAEDGEPANCAIGAVKSNIGHLDTAAGVAGLIKTVLALKHQEIPPSLHYEAPNPRIDFARTPFHVNAQLTPWTANGAARRAGVSSFGLGGTNAHVVLEEAPPPSTSAPGRRWQVLTLSAKNANALQQATAHLSAYLADHPDVNLADVAYTLQRGRRPLEHRRAIICRDGDAVAAMQLLDPDRVYTSVQTPKDRPVVFMFTGQGSQHVDMGRELYESEAVFRDAVDRCCALLRPHLGFDLREVLYPQNDELSAEVLAATGNNVHRAEELINQTFVTQPALFVLEYALAQLWQAWGLQPKAMIGHSIGEYVAACLAGVFSLEDALRLVAARGRLMQALPAGAMLVTPLPEAEVLPLLNDRLSLAAVNGAALCVVSGEIDAVDELEGQLTAQGLGCRRLHTSHAFHSAMMEPMLEAFTEEVRRVTLHPPQRPYLSNVTGAWIGADEATDPNYWAQHIRRTVRFADGLHRLVQDPNWLLLEVGPGQTLMTLARWHPERAAGQVVLTSLPRPNQEGASDAGHLMTTLGRLWIAGVRIDWAGFYADEERQRLPLPLYPFERRRYWIDARPAGQLAAAETLQRRANVGDWFYAPSWKRSAPVNAAPLHEASGPWLIFADDGGLGEAAADRLRAQGQDVVTVHRGDSFARRGDADFVLDPGDDDGYPTLWQALQDRNQIPRRILHLWSVDAAADTGSDTLDLGFFSLVHLAQALGATDLEELHIDVVTDQSQDVTGGDARHPEQATVIGACRAIAQEFTGVTCRQVDLSLDGDAANSGAPASLLAELTAAPDPVQMIVAYRGPHRWVQEYAPMALPAASEQIPRLRSGGVYLITGGLGGIGLAVADFLARSVQARLILTGRSSFPDRAAWDAWLATHEAQDPTSVKIRQIQALEAAGGEVMVLRADVADLAQMQSAVEEASARWGSVNGVIHAAGIAGGGLLQLKQHADAEAVLAPKVQGTRVLEAVFRETPLDFMLLCSSRAAILGGFGQADYCAANAFLDAYAHYANARGDTFTVSVNWSGWRDVGMRVDTLHQLGNRAGSQPVTVREIGHPLLARCIEESPEREVFSTQFSVATHWVLDDHRIVRQPIVPGTTYLEMVRAALEPHAGDHTIELLDIYFLSALPVREDETKEVRAVLERNGDEFAFRVMSKMPSAQGDAWQEYVIGRARLVPPQPPVRHDIAALIRRCNRQELLITDDNPIVTYEDLGPRWQSLRQVWLGDDELVAVLELPKAFEDDLAVFKLHPALLDRANFTAKVFLAADGLHLPFGYRGLHIKRPLAGKIYLYAKYKPNDDPLFETITFDSILMDAEGVELAVVDEFSQKRVREMTETIKAMSAQAVQQIAAPSIHGNGANGSASSTVRDEMIADGISPQEGIDAFRRILAGNVPAQVVVSPEDLNLAIRQAQQVREARLEESIDEVETSRPKHERPDVQTTYEAPRNQVEADLVEIWQETLGIEPIGVHDNFFELGGDSVVGIQMIARFKRAGYQISPQQLFQNQTVAELAAALDVAPTVQTEQGPVSGPVMLTPSQRWLLDQDRPDPHHFNQIRFFDVAQPVDAEPLRAAVDHLMRHHDALRLRFEEDEGGRHQVNAAPDEMETPFTWVDLSHLPAQAHDESIAIQTFELQCRMNLSPGPLVHFAYFDRGDAAPGKLLIVAHYLVIDSLSWWILLADLDSVYGQLRRGEDVQLPPKTTSFQQWAERLTAYAESPELRNELPLWTALPFDKVLPLPVDDPLGSNDEASTDRIALSLDAAETQTLLHDAQAAYHTVVNDLLLTAIVQVCAAWTGKATLLVDLEDHGRDVPFDDVDLSRTVGSLRAIYPQVLDLEGVVEPGEALKTIKEQLRRPPHGGVGYGLLRYLCPDPEVTGPLRAQPQPQMHFSYQGQIDQILAADSVLSAGEGPDIVARSPRGQRAYLLEITGVVSQGRFRLEWRYSRGMLRPETVQWLAEETLQTLRSLMAHCQDPTTGGYTPSDFPLAAVNQQQLDRITARFAFGR